MKIEKDILKRYASGQCTTEESNLVEAWFEDLEAENSVTDDRLDEIVARLDNKIKPGPNRLNTMIWAGLAAAVVCVFIGVGVFRKGSSADPTEQLFVDIADIKAPTGAHATLVLEDQSEYSLDEVKAGDTLKANGYQLTRLTSGALQYVDVHGAKTNLYHTLRTRSGGNVCLKLADGSSVWVNANSELNYPVQFAATREVRLSGEAYFEIAKLVQANERVPFYVRGDKQTIKVLGTKFDADFGKGNLIALLEGKVALSNTGSALESKESGPNAVLMQPGHVYSGNKLVVDPHIERYIDWKEGYFDVEGTTLGEFSHKLSDWYGVQVEVANKLAMQSLFGRIDRKKDLVEVLDIVAQTFPIRYALKNNKVMIAPK